ncbi:MAG TPA: TonB-dependent receptor [Bacteroidetes bacterium]|nr:TonB-dependent receptor [Bacteroidota bacterium]
MSNRIFVIAAWLLAAMHSPGVAGVPDTVDLREVKLVHRREVLFHSGQQALTLDREMIFRRAQATLDELLSVHLPSGILSYGAAGSLSTIRLRGAGSNHTQVSWNGIPLGSLTTGTPDLSLVPAFAADRLSLVPGASGSLAGSGTFGGAVFLSNEPDWSFPAGVRWKTETGSFGDRRLQAAVRVGNNRVQWDTRIIHHRAANNFSYHDPYLPGNPVVTQSHSSFRSLGLIQHVFLRLPRHHDLNVGVWYQDREKEIPAIMGAYTPGTAVQRDSSLRMYVQWRKRYARSVVSAHAATVFDYMRYDDAGNGENGEGLHSFYHTRQAFAGTGYRRYITDRLMWDAGVRTESRYADVPNYGKIIREVHIHTYSGLKWETGPVITQFSLRKPFYTGYSMPWLVSLATRWNISADRWWTGITAGNRYRLPSLNEWYWTPGGDPGLKPETGWSLEWMNDAYVLGSEHALPSVLVRTSLYTSSVGNWIQWVPGEAYWSPVNYRNVWSRGLDMSAIFEHHTGSSVIKGKVACQFIRATNRKVYDSEDIPNRQLPYIPLHSGNISLLWETARAGIRLEQQWNGKRFTTADNHPAYALDAWMRTDLEASYRIRFTGWTIELSGRIRNIFHAEYQLVRSYALPGRSFHLGLSLKWDQGSIKSN